jgi:hypothetical protein
MENEMSDTRKGSMEATSAKVTIGSACTATLNLK